MDLENEFKDTSYNEFLIKKAELSRIPIMGTFELTPVCNMKCNMCYIQQEGQNVNCQGGLKSVDFWEYIIDQAIEQGMLFCLLTGGEIFTYPHFKELYERIIKKPIYVVLNTNATLLNDETVEWLAQHPPRRLNISLYGSNSDTYEKLCHYRDGFDKTMHAFQLLNQYNIPFRVHSVLVPSNIHDYEGIIKICNELNAKLEMSYYMFPPVRKDMKILEIKERFTPQEMAIIALKYNKDKCQNDKDMWKKYVVSTIDTIKDYKNNKMYGFDKVMCKNGICSFWINWKGKMSGCGISDENVYDLEIDKFEKAWGKIVEYINNTRLSHQCSICQYRSLCPVCLASAFCETGRVNGTPKYLCDFCENYVKILYEEYERYVKNE